MKRVMFVLLALVFATDHALACTINVAAWKAAKNRELLTWEFFGRWSAIFEYPIRFDAKLMDMGTDNRFKYAELKTERVLTGDAPQSLVVKAQYDFICPPLSPAFKGASHGDIVRVYITEEKLRALQQDQQFWGPGLLFQTESFLDDAQEDTLRIALGSSLIFAYFAAGWFCRRKWPPQPVAPVAHKDISED